MRPNAATEAERAATQRLDDALKAKGAGIDQWRILSLLVAQDGCPMNVVAEHALLLAPKLSKLVDRMVSMNLVLRRVDEQDRRRVLIFASARGKRALAEWDVAAAEVQEQFREILGPDAPCGSCCVSVAMTRGNATRSFTGRRQTSLRASSSRASSSSARAAFDRPRASR